MIERQKTIRQGVATSGKGLFTGEKVELRLSPAPVGHGIVFQRGDLSGRPSWRAHLDFVKAAPRCTRLGTKEGEIFMVEHLLSALYAEGIDNLKIEVSGPEIPSGDGSALLFTRLLEEAGIEEQEGRKEPLTLNGPVYWSEGEIHLIALPAEEFRISYTLHYPQSPLLGSQYYTLQITPDRFKEEIAPSRTFSLYEEIAPFIEKGIIKGGGLDNALVIQGDKILNPEGARFPNEPVRHKLLDLIGDLSLLGRPLKAHVIALCSGHATNVAFAKLLAKNSTLESR